MRNIPEWTIQLAWAICGVFATGAVWYFLSLKQYSEAAYAAVGALIFGGVAIYLHRRKDEADAAVSPADDFVRRYTGQASDIRFIKALPKLRRVVYDNAREGWDTGVTVEMRQASYDLIDFLEYAWLRLAEFYPAGHFGLRGRRAYIRNFIRDRFQFHRSKHEPDGPGTGGTIVGVLAGGDVIDDLERMISDTVRALFVHHDNFRFDEWQREWAAQDHEV
ncbi:hypothetical protein [Burkholderia cenocepacia]|uniref:hypothetical protein n=1 Tax=Burkholderia cenocepacia TaxID=95486 RepID=UPI00075AA12E|nr:hypothetical protein [Burkholderia cenocepacia]AOK33101.1 hypothetical protein WL90_02055 [Burkholderia cenocepacia]KWF69996.1 hypothetical protein WL89_05510 [Burkholderia cenocepacia]